MIWIPESVDFLEKSDNHSLILNIALSPFCEDSEHSFELLIESINSPQIVRKIKHVNITDATYLYRHFYPSIGTSPLSPSPWYASNKGILEKLHVSFTIVHWNEVINFSDFQASKEKILREYYGDYHNDDLTRPTNTFLSPDLKFRDFVTAEAAVNAFKYNCDISKSLDFIFEQCAYVHSRFLEENFVCSQKFSSSINYLFSKYSRHANCLFYDTASFLTNADNDKNGYKPNEEISKTEVESAVANFMQNEVTNLNFFVVDNKGKMIYSNFSLEKLVDSNLLAEDIDKTAWQSTREVILTGKTFIGEETRENGYTYLSMKAPLIIGGKIKGAIGLSIDITDSKRIEVERKRASDLEFLSRLQQVKINFQDEFTQFISQMAHDITSPLASLEVFAKSCHQLTAPQQFLLSSITSSIKNIAGDLLKKYRYNKRELDASRKQVLMVHLAIVEVINQKRLQYGKSNVHIDFLYDKPAALSAFINMDQSNFSRVISNLINNAVEACKEQPSKEIGIININFTINHQNAVIEVSDNGNGMSQEMVNQLTNYVPLKTNKEKGCGLGLCQVLENVKLSSGKINVISKPGKGTLFKVMFPLLKQPKWLAYQLELPLHSTVLAVDDNTGALSEKSKAFLLNNFASLNNLKIFESVDGFEDYVDSLSLSEKGKVFVVMEYRAMNTDSDAILDSILRYNLMMHSLIITEICNDRRLQDFVEMSGGKMVPKLFLDDLKIISQ